TTRTGPLWTSRRRPARWRLNHGEGHRNRSRNDELRDGGPRIGPADDPRERRGQPDHAVGGRDRPQDGPAAGRDALPAAGGAEAGETGLLAPKLRERHD